jgi:uncharacterized protein YecE (DUF72 family)
MATSAVTTGSAWIGTSGWAYAWTRFYPAEVRAADRLGWYASRFRSVEVNTSFYHFPPAATYRKWMRETPPEFVFTLKLHRSITHMYRLRNAAAQIRRFLAAAAWLEEKLGPFLVQLPPQAHANAPRLAEFLDRFLVHAARAGIPTPRVALEARHASWFESADVLAALSARDAALVFAHSSRFPYPDREPLTARWVFLRFHGPTAWCSSEYGPARLRRWSEKSRRWLAEGRDVYAYFNNDVHGYAPRDAARLAAQLG